MVDFERSASTATISLFSRPSSTSVRPKASRVAGPSLISNLVFAGTLAELLHGKLEFFGVRRRSVELRIILHKGDALAFYGVGHNAGGRALGGFGFLQRGFDGFEIVAVDLDGVPAEGAPFIRQRRHLHNV